MKKDFMLVLRLSWKTIAKRKNRTIYIVILVALTTLALFCGALLLNGAELGVKNTAERLGADLMVVPEGSDAALEGVLLRSEPSSFCFEDGSIFDQVAAVEGVERASKQLYLQSLEAACCSVPVQLIVYDSETDFTITPWIESTLETSDLQMNDVLIGALVEAIPGDEIILYGQQFRVVARLDETGSGFDSSIFMESHTAQRMIELSKTMAEASATENADAASCVMVEVADGYKPQAVAERIQDEILGVEAVQTESVLNGISNNLQVFSMMMRVIIIGVWVMAVLIMTLLFTFSLNMRYREFGMLRMIGATRGRLAAMVFVEAAITCLLGAAIGCFIGCLIVIPFKTLIAESINFPYISPSFDKIALYAQISVLINTLTGPLACVYSALKISKAETFLLIRD